MTTNMMTQGQSVKNESMASSGLGHGVAGLDVMLQARAAFPAVGSVAAPASRKRLVELVGEQVERIRADTLVPLLGARQRWQLLVELLLGHAEIRGGRTRDYPFSEDRQRSCEIVQLFRTSTRPDRLWRAEVRIDVPEHLLVVALQVVVSSDAVDRPRSELDAERFYSEGLRFLIEEVVAGGDTTLSCNLADQMGLGGDQTQDAKAWNWQSRPVKLARLLAALSCAFSRPPPGSGLPMASDCPGRSSPASSVRRTDAKALVQQLAPSRDLLGILRRSRVRVVTMQAKHVQLHIDQCQRGFIQRGASFWISHNVARLRDHFANSALLHGTLIVDNEAKTSFVLPPELAEDGYSRRRHLDALEEVARKALYSEDNQISPTWVGRHFPRLLPFLDAARAEGKSLPSVLPAVEISIRDSALLDFALDAMEPGSRPVDRGLHPDARVISPGANAVGPAAITEGCNPACSGVLGHQRLAAPDLAIPGWLRTNAGEGYGFAGIAYGLAAHTFARSSADAIRKLVAKQAGRDVRVPETQRQLAAAAGIASRQPGPGATVPALAHVKVDGDDIGRLFLSYPSLHRPGVSMALEDLIRQAWIRAMARLVKRLDLHHLPALLIYLGGDDLLVTMPRVLIAEFMLEFDCALEQGCRDTGLDVRFTFACVAAGESGASATEGESVESIGAVNKALGEAKSLRTVDPKPAAWRELGRLHGMLG